VLAAGASIVGVFFANTGHPPPQTLNNEPPSLVAPPPKAAALSAVDREAARVVAARFMDTAVMRRHTEESWDIVAPAMRKGFTRASWASGNIPVVPFPAEAVLGVKFDVDWSGERKIYLRIAIVPKPASNVDGQAFDMGLEQTGDVGAHHWIVDYFVPYGLGQPSPAKRAAIAAAAPELKSRIPAVWIILPVAFIAGLILMLPVGLGARGLYRKSRAERHYRQTT
jgi:hypothetical protein